MRPEEDVDPWARAHGLLDDRRDPRGDARLEALLEHDPEARAELERLTRRLARLERPPRAMKRRGLAVAALVLLAPLGALVALRGGGGITLPEAVAEDHPGPRGATQDLLAQAPRPAARPPAARPAPPLARVLDYSVVVERVHGRERFVTTTTAEGTEHRHESFHDQGHFVLAWTRR